MWSPGAWENWQTWNMGISFGQQMVSLHITRTLLHTQLSYQAHQEQTTIWYRPISTQTYHQSLHHTCQQSDARIGSAKAIQGMMGKARTSQAVQDLQHIIDATQAHLQAHPNKLEETITPGNTRNTQWVPRVQAPPSIPKPSLMITDKSRASCNPRHQF